MKYLNFAERDIYNLTAAEKTRLVETLWSLE